GQLGRLALEGIDAGLLRVARLERLQSGLEHPAFVLQRRDALRVDLAPDAADAPRREADRVAVLVDAPPDPVDPADAQRFIDRFGPGDARLPRAFLVEADEQLVGAGMVLHEPRAKVGRRLEELRFDSAFFRM